MLFSIVEASKAKKQAKFQLHRDLLEHLHTVYVRLRTVSTRLQYV